MLLLVFQTWKQIASLFLIWVFFLPLLYSCLQIFTFSQKISVNFQLILRFIQGVAFMLAIAGIAVAVVLSSLTVTDIFASILAFIPTGWGILSVCSLFYQHFQFIGPIPLFDKWAKMLMLIHLSFCFRSVSLGNLCWKRLDYGNQLGHLVGYMTLEWECWFSFQLPYVHGSLLSQRSKRG